jgi:hypothetical protein
MPEHRIDLANLVAGLLRVDGRNDRLQQRSPVCRGRGVGRIGTRQTLGAPGLVEPERKRAHVRIQANRCGGIRPADTGSTNGEPVFAAQFLRLDKLQRGLSCAWPFRLYSNHKTSRNGKTRQGEPDRAGIERRMEVARLHDEPQHFIPCALLERGARAEPGRVSPVVLAACAAVVVNVFRYRV